ncbi:MAG TPA: hypothetical protein VGN72_02910 [Tepidisphaeraceae bacterium]|nr:hypothetical protein [Tepidisphaeraceae bacterium]
MKTPETSRLFTRWANPCNGLESLILTERLAPVQMAFYFATSSFTDDGRFLWLHCGFPPPGGRHAAQVLGVVDFERDELRIYPETQHPTARPLVDTTTGEVYWGNQFDIWKRGPHATDRPERVNRFPTDLAPGRLQQIATHLTFSADRHSLNVDARMVRRDGSTDSHIGEIPLDGAPFRLWQTLDGQVFNHGMFSPTDPDVQMVANEYWQQHADEPFEPDRPYHRLWTIRRGDRARPILKAPVSHSGHEWWDADGRHVWYVHYGVGIKKVNLASGEESTIWPGRFSHAQSDRTGRYIVADRMRDPVASDCHVVFCDTHTGMEVEIVNRPPLADDLTQCTHLHPHPHFCCGDRYICHTTTIYDRVDLALVPVKALLEE